LDRASAQPGLGPRLPSAAVMTISVTPLRPDDDPTIRVPQLNIEAEQAVLGAIFIDNRAYARVSEFLQPEHFGNAMHGRIFAAIGTLLGRGQIANPVTLKNLFDQDGALTEIGGAQYLGRLAGAAALIINAEDYACAVHDLYLRRELIALGEDVVNDAFRQDLDRPPAQIALDHAHRIAELSQRVKRGAALDFTVASSLAGKTPPERPWLIRDWIPRRQVTLLSGDGGTGKSILAMQLQVATASEAPWLGLRAMQCRSFGLYAEDEGDELHRRLYDVAKLMRVDEAGLDNATWRSTVSEEAELVELDERGRIRPTSYFHRLRQTLLQMGARLLILDAATNLYGGDEINRRQVNAFVGLLRRLAIEIDGAVVLLSHPSVQGINTGSGRSGSTHWHNAVRSRLYFTRDTGDDADPDERNLERMKANYAASGAIIRARWTNGAFLELEPPAGIDRAASSAKADRLFVSLLQETYEAGTWTSPNLSARNYAPLIFAKHPNREGLGKHAFELAMHRLKRGGRIKTEKYGKPSDPRTRLCPA
jgi:RecA-family ATPase